MPILLAATALHLTLATLIPGIHFFNAAMICCLVLYFSQPQKKSQ